MYVTIALGIICKQNGQRKESLAIGGMMRFTVIGDPQS